MIVKVERSRPVTPCRAISGVPNAAKGTGAVFAMSEVIDAVNGGKPRPMRMADVTATGVPNPAAPSKKAPRQKATSTSCKRGSCVILARLY